MQGATPIDTPIDAPPHNESRTQTSGFARGWLWFWSEVAYFFGKRRPDRRMRAPQDVLDEAKRKFDISPFDIVGGELGFTGVGKSFLTNNIFNATRKTPGGRIAPVGVDECTTKPAVYFHPRAKHVKILDVPGMGTLKQGSAIGPFVERNCLEVVDYVILVYSNRLSELTIALRDWCIAKDKPFVIVRTHTDSAVHEIAEEYEVSMRRAFKFYKAQSRRVLQQNGISDGHLFLIDNKKWEAAINAFNRGDHANAVLPYDEGKLLRFIAKTGLARYSATGTLTRAFRDLFKGSAADDDTDHQPDESGVPDDLEAVIQELNSINKSDPEDILTEDSPRMASQTTQTPFY